MEDEEASTPSGMKRYMYHLSIIVGRPPTKWTDDLVKVAGSHWMRAAQDQSSWRALGEAYI
jgi:hypothetical protein